MRNLRPTGGLQTSGAEPNPKIAKMPGETVKHPLTTCINNKIQSQFSQEHYSSTPVLLYGPHNVFQINPLQAN
jgi:hypothetical protein